MTQQAEVERDHGDPQPSEKILNLFGRTVAADALHTRREVSAQIIEKCGDCVLPLERN